jgi:CRP/FNR family cyclic AMP-dependent transcriptional regulator
MVAIAGEVLFNLISPQARAWLASVGTRRTFEDGALIHSRGDPTMGMDIVISGQVRLCTIRPDGTHTFLSSILPGQNFGDSGLIYDGKRSHDAIAIGPTVTDHFDLEVFEQIIDYPEIVRALYRITALRLGVSLEMTDDLRGLPRDIHLTKILLHQWRLNGRKSEIPCVQDDLAGLLGTSTMTLSKCLNQLKREGLIETGYRKVVVIDPEGMLAKLSGRVSR